tara:strand:- start:3 stop:1094 length:1092 start_codon:yes stop_codon:yes gene_type:complete
MATYYVTTAGSDTNSGTEANPFLTISKGWNTAGNGDTIIVNDSGTYTVVEGGANQLTTGPGKLRTSLTIKAGDGCSPVFDGGGSATYCMKMWNTWTVEGLTFRNFDCPLTNAVLHQYYSHNAAIIRDCTFHDITGMAVNIQKTGTVIERCIAYNVNGYGVFHAGLGNDNVIKHCLIYNCKSRAAYAAAGSVLHCTIYNAPSLENNGQSDVQYRLTSTYAEVTRYNVIANCNVRQYANAGDYTSYNCVSGSVDHVHGNTVTNYMNDITGTGDLDGDDPQFANAAGNDYTLLGTSPCIAACATSTHTDSLVGASTRTWEYSQLIFGITAAIGGSNRHPDMGCYENGSMILGARTALINKVMGAAG